ncbi:Serine/threonine-protein kinase EDR1 [Balamuthia mandrillaris]
MKSATHCAGWCCHATNHSFKVPGLWRMVAGNLAVAIVLGFSAVYLVYRLYLGYSLSQQQRRRQSQLVLPTDKRNLYGSLQHLQDNETDGRKSFLHKLSIRETVAVLPIYYVYSVLLCLWFLLQGLVLLLPPGGTISLLGHVFYIGHAFLDNVILVYLMFRQPSQRKAAFWSCMVGVLLCVLKGATLVIYEFSFDCASCPIFFPAPQAFFDYIAFAVGYYLILVCNLLHTKLSSPSSSSSTHFLSLSPSSIHRTRREEQHQPLQESRLGWKGVLRRTVLWQVKPVVARPAFFVWTSYLAVVYTGASFGSALVLFGGLDAGYCIITVFIFIYNICNAPLLYRTFLADTKYLLQHKLYDHSGGDRRDPFGEEAEATDDEEQEKHEKSGFSSRELVLAKLRESHDQQVHIIPWKDLDVGQEIARGGYGQILTADYAGVRVAIKRILDVGCEKEAFLKEVGVMSGLSHPNVLPLVGVVVEPRFYGIVTEFVPRGNLFSLLHSKKRGLTAEQLRQFALDTATGMEYLHSCSPPILHRDLKTMNLLVARDWSIKICDFGLSRFKIQTELMSRIGTVQWVAPEILRGEAYNEKCDVYSFGIILWELWSKQAPFASAAGGEVMPAVRVATEVAYHGRRPPIASDMPAEMAALIRSCWQDKAHLRPSFSKVLEELREMPLSCWRAKVL